MVNSQVWRNQIHSAGVEGFNAWKEQSLAKQMEDIVSETVKKQNLQNINFENALQYMVKMRQFLSNPDGILGSGRTKHGEVAEHLEVNVRNAWAALKGQDPVATFEGVGRTAPEDFILNGMKYQSKFINGENNTLASVLDHLEKYRNDPMHYTMPKDQYEIIEKIRSGVKPEDLNERSIQSILRKVEEIELQSGETFQDIVDTSIAKYDEVQLGKVGETVSEHQEKIVDENQKIQDTIQEDASQKKEAVQAKTGPSVSEGVKVAGTAAAITASVNTITVIYSKVKGGKKVHEFDKSDWSDVGLSAVKGGAKGGVTAGSIYALTNLTSLSAPFAGAVTSAGMGMTSLLVDVKKKEISMDEFVTQGQILCMEAGIAAIGGGIGQILIPVPVLGSIIGTVTANFLWEFSKGKLGVREQELKQMLDAYTNSILEKVDQVYIEIVDKIKKTYAHYDSLIEAAFDVRANSAVLAATSVKLAEAVGVDEDKILYDEEDLDAFFLN